MQRLLGPFTALLALTAVEAGAAGAEPGQQITRAAAPPVAEGSADYFTGKVRVQVMWNSDEHNATSGGLVSFEPGARSAWHTHPKGQRLLVMSGTGLTQEWGKPVQEIRAGDVVWCPPGVKHWHGASPDGAMTHLALTGTFNGKNVEWMEKVSDEQYKGQ